MASESITYPVDISSERSVAQSPFGAARTTKQSPLDSRCSRVGSMEKHYARTICVSTNDRITPMIWS